jgi:hypothetical protein
VGYGNMGSIVRRTSKTFTNVSSTSIASNKSAMTTCPSPSTKKTALTQAPGPWNNARNATCGRYVKVNSSPRITIDVMVNGTNLLPQRGQNSRCAEKYQIPLKGYSHEELTTFRTGTRTAAVEDLISGIVSAGCRWKKGPIVRF